MGLVGVGWSWVKHLIYIWRFIMDTKENDEKQSDYSKLCDQILGPPKPMKTCSLCNKRMEERYFHSIRYGYEMCIECWQKRIF